MSSTLHFGRWQEKLGGGCEELAEHHAIAAKRLARPTALDMFAGAA